MIKNNSFLKLLLITFFLSCGKSPDGELALVPAFWGHLEQVQKSTDTKLFLIHLKDQTEFNVCLSQELSEQVPVVEEEIKAAINIWGYYIARRIQVNITKRALQSVDSKNNLNTLTEKNYELCPGQTDIIVGFAQDSKESSWVGITTYTYFTKKPPKQDEISKYKRGLYLRKGENGLKTNTSYKWIGLAQKQKKALLEADLLKILTSRQTKIFLPVTEEKMSLRLLVHEFGHVWGLCDQYPMDEGKSNCDPLFSSLDEAGKIEIHDESTMGSSGWISELFLSDDDIEGIRELAERNFGQSFDAHKVDQILIPELSAPILEHFSFQESKILEGVLHLSFAIKSHKNLNVHLSFFDEVKGKWNVYNPKMNLEGPAEWSNFTWTFKLSQIENIKKFKMILSSPEMKGEVTLQENI